MTRPIYDLTTPGIRIYPEPDKTIIAGYLPGTTSLETDINQQTITIKGTVEGEPFSQELPIGHEIDNEHTVIVWENNVLRMVVPRA